MIIAAANRVAKIEMPAAPISRRNIGFDRLGGRQCVEVLLDPLAQRDIGHRNR
jgi:hypothetical protein